MSQSIAIIGAGAAGPNHRLESQKTRLLERKAL